MNRTEEKYSREIIIREMMDTVDIIKSFNLDLTSNLAEIIKNRKRILFTGEGSSRIFPAKNAILKAFKWGLEIPIFAEGAHQASLYDMTDGVVFCASNSGRTKELIHLTKRLSRTNPKVIGLTSQRNTPLEKVADSTFILNCGTERAVAATKSVMEQALFYDSVVLHLMDRLHELDLASLAGMVEEALMLEIDDHLVDMVLEASFIYLAGYNDGVAEELTLKANEILGKKSDFLAGTYAVHGIEEVMNRDELVILINPIPEEIDKFKEVLVDGVQLNLIAISHHETPFPTILVPDAGEFSGYVFLAAVWNLYVEAGLKLGVNMSEAELARKVGNEVPEE
ncbi:MAG: SIS domain-containing protein [Bacteroidota bacterium]